jgi:branched-chain amino acid transport system substrate-binding protein
MEDTRCVATLIKRRTFLGRTASATGALLLSSVHRLWAAAERTEILIGGTMSQSGRFQAIVQPFTALANAWADRLNQQGGIALGAAGKTWPIRFIIYDDQSSPPTALKFYERLATVDKVDVFIGPFSSFLTNAALQASVTHHIPFFMSEANDAVMFDSPNKWRTTGLAPAEWEYKRIAELYAKKGGVQTFAILGRENLHERGSVAGFADEVRQHGLQVVYENLAPTDTKDFASIILAIKQHNPDVVLVEGIAPPWTIQFLKQARALGLSPKDLVVGHCPVPVIQGLGASAENFVSAIYSFNGDTPDHQEFKAICNAAGFEPWQYSEAGIRYRTYRRIEDALKRAGSLDKEAIRAAMWDTNLRLFGEEVIRHDERGYGTDYPYPVQVKDGKHVSLWPLSRGLDVHQFKNGQW